jgi:AraC-like DNA-binding protein
MYEFHHYLPVDDTMMDWGIYLTGVGRATIAPQRDYPPAGHPKLYAFDYRQGRVLPEFAIILVTDGFGTFESKETGQVRIQPNTLFMLFPGVWHRYKTDKQTGWTERWVQLNGIMPHNLLSQGYISPEKAVLYLSDPQRLISFFDDLLERINADHSKNTLIYSMETIGLFKIVIEALGSDNFTPDTTYGTSKLHINDPLVKKVLEIIWTSSHQGISVDSILMQVPASRRTLERRFLKMRGHTIHEEIIQCRLSRSKRLLRETQLPVKTVAYLSGFGSSEKNAEGICQEP